LDDVGLQSQRTEIEKCLKLRYKDSESSCIITINMMFCIISNKLQTVVYKIHIIHSKQYTILSDILSLLSKLEIYLDLSTKRLLIEERKVREKLDELSTKKLRTKNTVKTLEQLGLAKDLQNVVHDDLEGLREMREATFSTLDSIITDRVNTSDIKSSLRFMAKKIQKVFPSRDGCCLNNGDQQQFIFKNINAMSSISMTMSDCHKYLNENERLKGVIEKINVLQRCETKISRKHNGLIVDMDEDRKEMVLYFEEDGSEEMIDLIEEFDKLQSAMSVTICDMNKHCSTLQELYQIKSKLGKQLVKFVKYHWK